MNGFSGIINLIVAAVSAKLTYTLSQQIQKSQQGGGSGSQGSWTQRLAGRLGFGGPASWMDRFSLGRPSAENQSRLDKSNRAYWGAMQAHESAKKKHRDALAEYASEEKDPTGKNLDKLQIAISNYEHELQEAAKVLKKVTAEHEKVKGEVARQTEWQKERTKGNLWSPMQAIRKAKQHFRVFRKQWQRFRGAAQKLRLARRAHQGSQLRGATAVKATGDAVKAASAARNAAGARVAMQGMAMAARAGPYVAAIAAVTVLVVGKMKQWVDQQLHKAEASIEGRIREKSAFNAKIANATARYEQQQMRLNIRTGAETSESAKGLVESTMRLKESKQPQESRWEAIQNRWEAYHADAAKTWQDIINAIDFVTPAVEKLLNLVELLPWIKKIEGNTRKESQEVNATVEQVFSAWKANNDTKQMKGPQPIAPIK